ncbi:MAG: hypothetical protein U1C33_06200 [Candidatus Cloacimonadaceae bacterium]|nr:hypothetical protein [Candidatus Cloacimonadaceae bacterium]
MEAFGGKQVVIDRLPKGRFLYGVASMSINDNYELYGAHILPRKTITATVRWTEPGDNKERSIIIVEDVYLQ